MLYATSAFDFSLSSLWNGNCWHQSYPNQSTKWNCNSVLTGRIQYNQAKRKTSSSTQLQYLRFQYLQIRSLPNFRELCYQFHQHQRLKLYCWMFFAIVELHLLLILPLRLRLRTTLIVIETADASPYVVGTGVFLKMSTFKMSFGGRNLFGSRSVSEMTCEHFNTN